MCEYLNTHFPEFEAKPVNVVWRQDNETANYNALHDLTKLIALAGDGEKPEENEVLT